MQLTHDIQYANKFFDFIIYADDTTLFNPLTHTNISDTMIIVELQKVYSWLSANKLSLNVTKTKYTIFHSQWKSVSQRKFNLKINDIPIERVYNFNFLGLTLNENLKWDSHINKISNKINRYNGLLSKLKHYLPMYTLKTLYDSFILPHLNYAILTWGFSCSRIFKLQKKSIRIISLSKYNSHTEPLFKTNNILKVEDIFQLNCLKFYYKFCNDCLPSYFSSFRFSTRSAVHSYNTRNKKKLNTNKTNSKFVDKCLRNFIPKLVNQTDSLIVGKISTHSLHGFSNYIKQYIVNLYQMDCSIPNCYVCNISN